MGQKEVSNLTLVTTASLMLSAQCSIHQSHIRVTYIEHLHGQFENENGKRASSSAKKYSQVL